jgi:hypothetical protein
MAGGFKFLFTNREQSKFGCLVMVLTAATYTTINTLVYHSNLLRSDRSKQPNPNVVYFCSECTRTPKPTVLARSVPLAHATDTHASKHTPTQHYW